MKRSSYLQHDDVIELGKRGVKLWCYGRTGKYVCRLEINAAGMAIYTGNKGGRRIGNLSWESVVDKLRTRRGN
jgi:hypothetical protein